MLWCHASVCEYFQNSNATLYVDNSNRMGNAMMHRLNDGHNERKHSQNGDVQAFLQQFCVYVELLSFHLNLHAFAGRIFKFSTVKLCFCYAFQFSARHNRAEMRSCSLFSIKCFLCYMCSHWFCKHFAVEFPSNSFSWNLADETVDYLVKCGQKLVNPMNAVWRPVCQKTYCNWHDDLLTILYQVLPSMLMDLFIKSPKHKLMPFVRKIMAMAEVIKFFNHNNFIFANSNYFSVIDG